MPGKLISIEGMDGSGKTTVCRSLIRCLNEMGYPTISSKEPGIVWEGQIRRLLLESQDPPVPMAELFLFLADRAQHVERVIKPALESGTNVILDRFIHSTLVYQGYLRRVLPLPLLQELNRYAVGEHTPSLTLVLDVPAEVAAERLAARGESAIRLAEREGLEGLETVRAAFKELCPTIVDGSRSPEYVLSHVLPHVLKELNRPA